MKQRFVTFLIIALLFGGCVTMGTRKRTGARCRDGSSSGATGRGACSHHRGVSYWQHRYWWE